MTGFPRDLGPCHRSLQAHSLTSCLNPERLRTKSCEEKMIRAQREGLFEFWVLLNENLILFAWAGQSIIQIPHMARSTFYLLDHWDINDLSLPCIHAGLLISRGSER